MSKLALLVTISGRDLDQEELQQLLTTGLRVTAAAIDRGITAGGMSLDPHADQPYVSFVLAFVEGEQSVQMVQANSQGAPTVVSDSGLPHVQGLVDGKA